MAKYYLDSEGVRILIRNFKSELVDYATKNYVDEQIENAPNLGRYDDTEVVNRLNTLENNIENTLHMKGSIANATALESIQNPIVGDVYNLIDTNMNVVWNGTNWDSFGEDIQAISIEDLNAIIAEENNSD